MKAIGPGVSVDEGRLAEMPLWATDGPAMRSITESGPRRGPGKAAKSADGHDVREWPPLASGHARHDAKEGRSSLASRRPPRPNR